jgi:preprotein translocase subunit SecF
MLTRGFNLGIDFTGGTLVDLKFHQPVSIAEVRDVLKEYQLDNSVIQFSETDATIEKSENVMIRTVDLADSQRKEVLDSMKEKLGDYDVLRTERVGATIGSELTMQAVVATLVSWVLIVGYLTYRFEFKFAIAGVLALVHNVLVVLGMFSLLQKEIDSAFVAALMTVVGYSVNDTVVIFDRIRENLRLHFRRGGDLVALANESISQTLTRSLYTVATCLFTIVALLLFGGDTTKNFAFALLIGISCGCYSSIFIATPLWVTFRMKFGNKR